MTDVSVSLRKAEADFTIKPDARLNVEAIRQAIRSYGFTPTWLELTVKAELTSYQRRPALRTVETGQFIELKENPQLDALRKALTGKIAIAVITAVIPEGKGEVATIKSFSLTDM
ncbi:MAG: hypothetical protein HY278_07265 [candidate division NC10 bacterium]|nr:hypothetical protein [candidate division NC10 bacterium]